MVSKLPLSTLVSQVLVAFTIELDNEFERRFVEAGGGARVISLTMWSNLLRFVGEGVTVGELVAATGLQKQQALSRLGGVERWGYVSVGTYGSSRKREGYGSARSVQDEWEVRFTPAGERAASIWPHLPAEIETRWRDRFGSAEIDGLAQALRGVDEAIDLELPDFLHVVSSTQGFALELVSVDDRRAPDDLPLVVVLAHVLRAYTADFEASGTLSLPLSANLVRVLRGEGTPVRELPELAGISKEAVAAALTSLAKTPYVVVDGSPASKRMVRLTAAGEGLPAEDGLLHSRTEKQWEDRVGADDVIRLRAALDRILDLPGLATGLRPYPDGWRASKPYVKHTEAVVADPRGRLPHYPMVLHRGGWPDGS